MTSHKLILASSSKHRAQSLARFKLPFSGISPDIDESPLSDESAEQLALRLSVEKARKVHLSHPGHVIIGSDQVAVHDGRVCGKPGTQARAIEQLSAFSDSCIEFFTGLCVITTTGRFLQHVDCTTVVFRSLKTDEIVRYIDAEQPLDCAGSFKMESMGLSLFKAVQSEDPSALVGLPLIRLCEFLRQAGYQIP